MIGRSHFPPPCPLKCTQEALYGRLTASQLTRFVGSTPKPQTRTGSGHQRLIGLPIPRKGIPPGAGLGDLRSEAGPRARRRSPSACSPLTSSRLGTRVIVTAAAGLVAAVVSAGLTTGCSSSSAKESTPKAPTLFALALCSSGLRPHDAAGHGVGGQLRVPRLVARAVPSSPRHARRGVFRPTRRRAPRWWARSVRSSAGSAHRGKESRQVRTCEAGGSKDRPTRDRRVDGV